MQLDSYMQQLTHHSLYEGVACWTTFAYPGIDSSLQTSNLELIQPKLGCHSYSFVTVPGLDLASFPGRSHLQYLIAYSMQIL